MDPRKHIFLIVGATAICQLIAMLVSNSIWVVVLPPVIGSLPIAFLTSRSAETVRLIEPNLRRAFFQMALLSCAMLGWFLWSGNDLRLDLKVTRTILTDVAIFWAASNIGVLVAATHGKHSPD